MNTSCDLADPQWELVDPTPNVHALFVQFNKRFFWGTLDSVSVRWSKRMYSCAGICRYEGRGGLCDIGLSEPLLKLRPRKDLVETLLHEMIHAYLFLAERDRDRDGHGPNFQAHMRRINSAANINITIYHDFHDEVRLYKTHWWRCNGPCQTRHPFFGLVKRTSNRAPGPNDFWWPQHQATCGGQFIKIKEPEKKQKKESAPKNRPSTSKGNVLQESNVIDLTAPIKSPKTLKDFWSKMEDKKSVAETVRDHWAKKELPNKRTIEVDGFVTPPAKVPKLTNVTPKSCPIEDFSIEDANALLKDIYGSDFTLNKRKYGNVFTPPKPKKVVEVIDINSNDVSNNLIACPACTKVVEKSLINEHLDSCATEKNKCGLCNGIIKNKVHICTKNTPDFIECFLCQEMVPDINAHLDACLTKKRDPSCPVCQKNIPEQLMNDHVDQCLTEDADQGCPVCGVLISRFSLEDHLSKCISNVDFELDLTSEDDFNESPSYNETGTKHPCPVCMKMVERNEMDSHITHCLEV